MEIGMFILIGFCGRYRFGCCDEYPFEAYEKSTIHCRNRDLCSVRHCLDCAYREYCSEGC